MFEEKEKKSSNPMLIFPLAALLVVAGGLAVYYLTPGPPPPPAQVEGMIRKGTPEFDRYSESLRLEQSKSSMTANFSGGETVLFKGSVLNLTTRTVEALEVTLLFFNHEETVGEIPRMVIHPAQDEPLPPQYERGISIAVDEEHFPQGWFRQHAEIEISGFRLTPLPQPVQ